MATPRLLGPDGKPVERAVLTGEIARATLGSVRSPLTGYPADGLTPVRLATILREADAGDAVRQLELIEFAEERYLHFTGVMGTRRRSVTQLPITVEAFSDDSFDEKTAEIVRGWLKRDELAEELFDILDCLPKGYSFTEIVWDNPGGDWRPARLERRDPRWFRFDRSDLATPMMLADDGREMPLPPGKFIYARMGAKSGLPGRSGLGRIALWAYLFLMFTQRDWQIFIQTYGQPLRLGKWQAGASESDKDTLFRAVANIAGDCAAIVPAGMEIEFVQSGQLSATGELYQRRAEHIDQSVSKLILGQTATTDAVTGGLGSGKEHRQVQEDIERADARALAAILNRDLIRPWFRLKFGPDFDRFPRLKIEREESEDLKALSDALAPFIDRGLRVPVKAVRDKFGLPEPEGDEEVLAPAGGAESPPHAALEPGATDRDPAGRALKRQSGDFKRGTAPGRGNGPSGREGPVRPNGGVLTLAAEGPADGPDAVDLIAERLAVEATPEMAAMMARVEAMIATAGSLPELREMLLSGFPQLDARALTAVIAQGALVAQLAGRVDVQDEDEGR